MMVVGTASKTLTKSHHASKIHDDLQLSDKEIQTVADAAKWFLKVQREPN
jgi:hypothetical protein